MMEEGKIKGGLNIYLYYWTIPVFVLFFLVNYYSRNFKADYLDIALMISVVSFLFGFLISISFSMMMNKSASLKKALSAETGRLVSLYLLSKKLGKEFHDKILERIDRYTINTLRDYFNYSSGREMVYGMYEDVDKMKLESKEQEVNGNSFLYILGEFQLTREELESLTGSHMEWSLKLANYILGFILIVLLFLNRADTFTNTIFIILSTVIIFIFLIMEDYDDLRIGDYVSNISNSEQIFDLIGKERYYPQEMLRKVRLEKGKEYRIGIWDSHLKKEKIFPLKYNPEFNLKLSKIVNKSQTE